MEREIETRVQQWLHEPYDVATRREVEALIKRGIESVRDAFYTSLHFGTGGVRGIMGVGTNRMNRYTVQQVTQGLANYLKSQFQTSIRVLIGFDSRLHSQEFALEAARVLAGNEISALLCQELRPTPFVSFGVRHMHCQAGIMITASHNPKEYNGYKVYWSDGGQVVSPHDSGIIAAVEKIKSPNAVFLAHEHHPLIEQVSLALDLDYLKEIHKLQLDPKRDQKVGDALKIVYTPLHGTGIKLLPRALKQWGFHNIHLVDVQAVPDGNFPTLTKAPNPEEKEVLTLGLKQLKMSQSHLLLATDPDADRLAIAVLHKGAPYLFNGNQIAAICAEYLCSTLSEREKLPANSALVTTIVSSPLLRLIAAQYKITYFEVLTGFKYIGALIHEWEVAGDPYRFLFGAEESYGYLMGTYTRDKDAMIAACLLCEIALLLQAEGHTLVDFLQEIFNRYGTFLDGQKTINFSSGESGVQECTFKMNALRKSPLQEIAGQQVEQSIDYLHETTGLPKADVLQFTLQDHSRITVRPSGTEPKLKIYASVRGQTMPECQTKLDALLCALL